MSDLVLRTRLAITRSSLNRVHALEEVVARGQRAFDDLAESIDVMVRQARDMVRGLDDVSTKASQLADAGPEFADFDDADDVVRNMRDIATGIDEVGDQLRKAREELAKRARDAKKQRVALLQAPDERNDLRMLRHRAQALTGRLSEANYWAIPSPKGPTPREECEQLFDEYVDVLRGMALREAGYGDEDVDIGDVFAIADQMPKLWAPVDGWAWGSLALPSRMEQNALTPGSVLRIGFPEWTIWALPLVQHDFGRIFAAKCLNLKDVQQADPDAARLGLLADACATIVTGPAYACAALLLRLDPQRVTVGATEALRSATIIQALSEVTSKSSDKMLGPLTERLSDEWCQAVGAAGAQPGAFYQATESEDVKQAVTRAVRMLSETSTVEDGKPLWAESWARITGSAKLLKHDEPEKIDLSEIHDADNRPVALAFLLNAAWLARIGPTPPEEAKAAEVHVIASGALRRMRNLPVSRPAAPRAAARETSNLGRTP